MKPSNPCREKLQIKKGTFKILLSENETKEHFENDDSFANKSKLVTEEHFIEEEANMQSAKLRENFNNESFDPVTLVTA